MDIIFIYDSLAEGETQLKNELLFNKCAFAFKKNACHAIYPQNLSGGEEDSRHFFD